MNGRTRIAGIAVAAAMTLSWTGPAAGYQELVGEAGVVDGCNRFGVALYGRVADAADGPNVLVSPVSVSMALAMAWHGAAGETRSQMGDLLGFGEMDPETLARVHARLLADLQGERDGVEVRVANSIWGHAESPLLPAFEARVASGYGAVARTLDFGSPHAADAINGWIRERTDGRIDRMLDRVPPDAVLYLVNAILFRGTWSERFDPARTAPGPFARADGSVARVPMMRREGTFACLEGDGYRGVRLPYGSGGRCAQMILLLPEGTDLAGLRARVAAPGWDGFDLPGEAREIEVVLPRMRVGFRTDLVQSLQGLGMTAACDPVRAEFPGIFESGEGEHIGRVLHEARLEVDESGTVAAAATVVEMLKIDEEPARLAFDRPFLFAIRDDQSGMLLFLGHIGDPSS